MSVSWCEGVLLVLLVLAYMVAVRIYMTKFQPRIGSEMRGT